MTVFQERVILALLVGIVLFTLGPNYFHFSLPLRVATVAVSLVLAGLVSWRIAKENKKKAFSIESEVKEERIFVPLAPQDLVGIHKGHTEIQAKKLTASYIDKWIRASGTVQNISGGGRKVAVTLLPEGANMTDSYLMLFLDFQGQEWLERLQILRRGHHLTVNGQIRGINSHSLMLENCELVKTGQ